MALLNSKKDYIGVDIGTSGIKIVELKGDKNNMHLGSYGFCEIIDYEKETNLQADIKDIAKVLNKIISESGISSRNAIASLPTYSVFSSVINLSKVDKKDIAASVNWEAKKVIPLPLEEMVLDWVKIDDGKKEPEREGVKILLTGAPRTLVEKYINIFKIAQINLLSLETETLSLIRSLIGGDKSIICLVEFGTNTTDISIIESGIPVISRSIDVGGLTITRAISRNLNISLSRAEQFKYDMGISSVVADDGIPKAIIDTVSPIANEIRYIINLYQGKENSAIEKILLSGGSSMLPNFASYLARLFEMKVIIGDPWSRISYPAELGPTLKELGPRLSIAAGLAMRDF
jgi:type IV pilus assembly protein PilM